MSDMTIKEIKRKAGTLVRVVFHGDGYEQDANNHLEELLSRGLKCDVVTANGATMIEYMELDKPRQPRKPEKYNLNGEMLTMRELVERTGLSRSAIYYRLTSENFDCVPLSAPKTTKEQRKEKFRKFFFAVAAEAEKGLM